MTRFKQKLPVKWKQWKIFPNKGNLFTTDIYIKCWLQFLYIQDLLNFAMVVSFSGRQITKWSRDMVMRHWSAGSLFWQLSIAKNIQRHLSDMNLYVTLCLPSSFGRMAGSPYWCDTVVGDSTRPRAIPLAMLTMKKETLWFYNFYAWFSTVFPISIGIALSFPALWVREAPLWIISGTFTMHIKSYKFENLVHQNLFDFNYRIWSRDSWLSSHLIYFFKGSSCSELGAPLNGQKSSSVYSHGSTITFSCNAGFTLHGSASRTCSNGQWSGTRTECRGTPFFKLKT